MDVPEILAMTDADDEAAKVAEAMGFGPERIETFRASLLT